jgi:hypothetical protein
MGGWFQQRRDRKRLEEATRAYTRELEAWKAERDEAEQFLYEAQHLTTGEKLHGLVLARDEGVFIAVEGAALGEERRQAGHYEGGSSGFSVPITGGRHAVRYRVGTMRGHYVPGPMVLTPIDSGTVVITNKRVIFQGMKQTRECTFSKLIGFQHHDAGGTTFSVSNRQKATVIGYGPEVMATFRFRLDLALAHYQDAVKEFVGELEEMRKASAQSMLSGPLSPRPHYPQRRRHRGSTSVLRAASKSRGQAARPAVTSVRSRPPSANLNVRFLFARAT